MSKLHFTEAELSGLSAKERALLDEAVDLVMKKRRIMFVGYVVAALMVAGGGAFTMIIYLGREPGTFWAWSLLVPFAGVGASLWGFGKLAKRAGQKRL